MSNATNREALSSYRELEAWRIAIELVESVYEVSSGFPSDERFGLTAQIRRAAVSIPSNIAEGYGRRRRGEYLNHLSMANGSLKEVETQLVIAGRLKFVDKEGARTTWELIQSEGRLLYRLMESLVE